MNLPGSPKLHVWLGLTVALAGILVGGYAYTGDRIYRIEFIPVAFVGFLLLVGGSTLAGYGQANRPRLGGNPASQDDAPSMLDRLKALVDRGAPSNEDDEADASEQVSVTVACPDCETVFETEGPPPFEATCPECGHEDTIEVPEPPA